MNSPPFPFLPFSATLFPVSPRSCVSRTLLFVLFVVCIFTTLLIITSCGASPDPNSVAPDPSLADYEAAFAASGRPMTPEERCVYENRFKGLTPEAALDACGIAYEYGDNGTLRTVANK